MLLRVDTPGGEITAMKAVVGRIENAGGPRGHVGWACRRGGRIGRHVRRDGRPRRGDGAEHHDRRGDTHHSHRRGCRGATSARRSRTTPSRSRGASPSSTDATPTGPRRLSRDARSATPDEAVELNVVDLVAATESDLIEAIEGREVELIGGRTVELQLATAPRVENAFNPYERVLAIVSDPLIVSLLLLIGFIGIGTELFFAPGSFLPGTAGAIALLLAFLGLGTLLPGETAIALLGLAALLVVLEIFIPTGGVLGAGAAIAVAIAVGIWIGGGDTEVGIQRVLTIMLGTIVAITLLIGAFVGVIAVRYLAPTRKPREDTGAEEGYQ